MNKKEWLNKFEQESDILDIDTLYNNIYNPITSAINCIIAIEEIAEFQQVISKRIRYGDNYDRISFLEEMADTLIGMIFVKHIMVFDGLSTDPDPNSTIFKINYMLQNLDIADKDTMNYYYSEYLKESDLLLTTMGSLGLLQYLIQQNIQFPCTTLNSLMNIYTDCLYKIITIMNRLRFTKQEVYKAMNIKIHRHRDRLLKGE